jgi:hypothetical protein
MLQAIFKPLADVILAVLPHQALAHYASQPL